METVFNPLSIMFEKPDMVSTKRNDGRNKARNEMAKASLEPITFCEPLMVAEDSPHFGEINELATLVVGESMALTASVREMLRPVFTDIVRAANCYYSNLIEGHDTHPISTERALKGDFEVDPKKCDLQLEAMAHIKVQRWIDGGGLGSRHPMDPEAICEMHQRFCKNLPESLLLVTAPETGEKRKIQPGRLREGFVQVGTHVPVSAPALPSFLDHMHRRYNVAGKNTGVLSSAYAHHRLAWVHPFEDLNGRVTRMVSHAMLLRSAGSEGLWSVSRGLALDSEGYIRQLAAADERRRGDRDGRGNLSEERLASFARFFLTTCLNQIGFMRGLFEPEVLTDRIVEWAARGVSEKRLRKGSDVVMKIAAIQGHIDRRVTETILNVSDRGACNVLSDLVKASALAPTDGHVYKLSMNSELALGWMPGLIPPKPVG
jgi:Fic family protein